METMRICGQCGAPLPVNAPEGLCPNCLMKVGLGSEFGKSGESRQGQSTAPSAAEIGKHFPQLEIVELLGQGGMGTVYKARQLQLDRFVALKILLPELSRDPAFAERFNREAKALARLNHPNIVAVYDFGKAGDFYYFIMEYVDGTNLWQMERAKQRLAPEEALAIVPKICDALQYAHDEGIVHRDIKPGNILIDKRGRVKIADFGLAKLVGKQVENLQLTQARMVLGTPQYMAPEQLDDPQKVDHRADIYSLGVVLYEMLTGELPMGRFALPSEKVQVDVRLDEVVLRSLERNVERRYQRVSDVKTDVETISGIVEKLPPTMRRAFGFEWRSKAELFGLPLVHIASGRNPVTGEVRLAKGIIAIGDKAKGFLAMGGMATGVFAFGGVAFGVVAVGGLTAGVISFGGVGIGLLFGIVGIGIAPWVFGGVAIGYVAAGGLALGVHAFGGNANDPVAQEFLVRFHLWKIWLAGVALCLLSIAVSFVAQAWARRRCEKGDGPKMGGRPGEGGRIGEPRDSSSGGPRKPTTNSRLAARVGAIVCLLIVLAAVGVTALLPRSYHAVSKIMVRPLSLEASATAAGVVRYDPAFMQTQFEMIRSDALLNEVAQRLNLDARWGQRYAGGKRLAQGQVLELLKASIDLRTFRNTSLFEIGCWRESADEAADIANAIAESFTASRAEQVRAVTAGETTDPASFNANLCRVAVLERARPPTRPARPNVPLNLTLGVVLGVVGGVLAGGLTLLATVVFGKRQQPPGEDRFWKRFAITAAVGIVLIVLIPLGVLLLAVPAYQRVQSNRAAPSQTGNQAKASRLTQEGWQLLQEGKLNEGTAKFQEATTLAPGDADAWNGLGWAALNSGKAKEAQETFQHVIALSPSHPGALNGLGQVYLSQRKYDLAETNLLKAAPDAPAAAYGLTRVYLLQGKFEEAEKWAQKLVASRQNDEIAQKMLSAAKMKTLDAELRSIIEPPTQ